jgi:hypothetical protein
MRALIQDISENNFSIATDGSVLDPDNASHSWIIHGNQSGEQLRGHGRVWGDFHEPSSFRAEGFGYLASNYGLHAIFKCYSHHFSETQRYKALAHIDNKGTIKRSQQPDRYGFRPCIKHNWDIYNERKEVAKSIPATITPTHVKSHQDRHKQYDELNLAAQLNVQADRLAGKYYNCAHCCRQ